MTSDAWCLPVGVVRCVSFAVVVGGRLLVCEGVNYLLLFVECCLLCAVWWLVLSGVWRLLLALRRLMFVDGCALQYVGCCLLLFVGV